MINLNDPYAREVFAYDFLEGRTVKGTAESIEYLTKMGVYVSKSKKRDFEDGAFILSEQMIKKLEAEKKETEEEPKEEIKRLVKERPHKLR